VKKKQPLTWETEPTKEFDGWFDSLDPGDQEQVIAAQIYLEETGPMARMPLSHPIRQPNSCGMKELRPGSSGRSEVRILYAFDYRRRAIMLLGGDKSGDWSGWYDTNVPIADQRFVLHEVQSRKEDVRTLKTQPKQAKQRGKKRKERR
jgi:hypothetical protein